MFNLIKDVIDNGNFELSKILNKIDKQWVEDKLTDNERLELINSAQGKANFKNSLDLYLKIFELDKKVKELETEIELIKSNNVGSDDAIGDTATEIVYPEYVVGKWYYNGDIITFDGKIYKCVAPIGQVCVWSPTEYPTYWEIVDETPETIKETETTE